MSVDPEPRCWLSPVVEVRRSPIEGFGLFSVTPIPRGALVSKLGGRLVTTQELRLLFSRRVEYVDTISTGPDEHLVLPTNSASRFGNHSCDPNLWWDGPYDLIARRNIEANEELTNDYATSTTTPEFAMDCCCRSDLCRGIVRGTDVQTYRLREAYAGHVIPALIE